jgi:myosin-5
LLAGATAEEKAELNLKTPKDYRYLNQNSCFTLKNTNEIEEFKEVREAFLTLNFKKHEKNIFQAISAILHLGNFTFAKDDSKNMDGVVIKEGAASTRIVIIIPFFSSLSM